MFHSAMRCQKAAGVVVGFILPTVCCSLLFLAEFEAAVGVDCLCLPMFWPLVILRGAFHTSARITIDSICSRDNRNDTLKIAICPDQQAA